MSKRSFTGKAKGITRTYSYVLVVMQPKSTKTIYAVVCSGTKEEVEKFLEKMNNSKDKYEEHISGSKTTHC